MPSDTKFGPPGQTISFWSHSAVCRTACRFIRPCAHSQALCGKKERIQTERKPIVQIEAGNIIHERRVRRNVPMHELDPFSILPSLSCSQP